MTSYYDPMRDGYVWMPKKPSSELQPLRAAQCPDQRFFRRASRAERLAYDKQQRKSRR